MTEITYTETLVTIHCYACAMAFAVPREWEQERRRVKDIFYCPAGHAQHFLGETHESKLARAKAEAASARERAEAAEEAAKKLKLRIAHGLCPCCNRSFVNLRRHMTNKHPRYKP